MIKRTGQTHNDTVRRRWLSLAEAKGNIASATLGNRATPTGKVSGGQWLSGVRYSD